MVRDFAVANVAMLAMGPKCKKEIPEETPRTKAHHVVINEVS